MKKFKIYLKISLLNGFNKELTYFFESEDKNIVLNLKIGDFVKVPIRKKFYWGIINSIFFENNFFNEKQFNIRPIFGYLKLEENNKIFIQKLSNHYNVNEKIFYKKLLSIANNKNIKISSIEENEFEYKENFELNKEQEEIFNLIKKSIINKKNNKFYLHGVTGSGKTSIYLFLAKYFIEEWKKNVIIIFPDTVLAIYAQKKFEDFFQKKVNIFSFHSESSKDEKNKLFSSFEKDELMIVIGVHLPIYLPVKNIGLYIIDEEHDSGFIEKNFPFVNSRDALIVKSEIEKSNVLLCSATPSIESWKAIKNNFYQFYSIKNRFNNFKISKIERVILQKENFSKESKWITETLKNEIQNKLNEKKQTLLFLNQKGLYSYARCKNCTKIFGCDNCSSFYTIYENFICICHRCEKKVSLPEKCTFCKISKYSFENCLVGTSNIKLIIQKIFPFAKIEQADSKTISNKKDWDLILEKMKNNEIDILIGTKMIARGYHFKNVELVGIICGDLHLGIPHVSSVEKTIQEIIQVSGRSGRESEGKVILQTLIDHDFYEYLSEDKYLEFCDKELEFRKINNFFPFKKTAIYLIHGFNETDVKNCSENLYKILNDELEINTIFYRPIKSYFYKIRNKYYYYIYGKADSYESLKKKIKFINFLENNFMVKIQYIPNFF